jgi:hypothetical protein
MNLKSPFNQIRDTAEKVPWCLSKMFLDRNQPNTVGQNVREDCRCDFLGTLLPRMPKYRREGTLFFNYSVLQYWSIATKLNIRCSERAWCSSCVQSGKSLQWKLTYNWEGTSLFKYIALNYSPTLIKLTKVVVNVCRVPSIKYVPSKSFLWKPRCIREDTVLFK